MPAACSACRCCDVLAVDCSLALASSSTVLGAWASRSSNSKRRGLANALPINAIASNSASFSARPLTVDYSIDHLIACQALSAKDHRVLSPAAERPHRLRFLPARLQDRRALRAVVDAHIDLVDEYVALAEAQGAEIAAVIETHVQADHVSGLPELIARTGATGYVPERAGVGF